MTKFDLFLNNSKELQNKFTFNPLLYGSLGLEVLTGQNLNSDDIDILIPELYLKGEKWEDFKSYLEQLGYVLIDAHEHTFIKGGTKYSYASIEELEKFAGIFLADISEREKSNIHYKLLDLKQYLAVYEASSKDGYRQNKKESADFKKIDFIKSFL